MTVDSFKFLPRLISTFYRMAEREPEYPIPWTPVPGRLADLRFGLITSGGLYVKSNQPRFDIDHEKADPTWGDPSYRTIPSDVAQEQIGVSHLHYNPADVLRDMNILLPISRFQELACDGSIGSFSTDHFSFMGYQGYPPDADRWENGFGPEVAKKFLDQNVNCVLLSPA